MKKILSLILCVILFVDVISLGIILLSKKENTVSANESETSANTDNDLLNKATVVCAGSNGANDELFTQAYARTGSLSYDFAYPYDELTDIISNADVAFFTQSSCISSEHNVSAGNVSNSPAELGNRMSKIGFDVVNIATPHCLDLGEKGLENSLNFWNEQGLKAIGAYSSKSNLFEPIITEANDIKIGWVGFAESTGGNSLPESSEITVLLSEYESDILKSINAADSVCDIVVVCVDWANNSGSEISDSQRQLAEKLVSYGADVIVGTGPAVIQNVEYIENQSGTKVPVAYSLGNLISASSEKDKLLGGLLTLEISKNKQTGSVSIESVKLDGVVTHYGHDMTNIRLYLLSDYDSSLASVHGIKETDDEFSVKYLKKLLNKATNN